MCGPQGEGGENVDVTFCSIYMQSKNCGVDMNYR